MPEIASNTEAEQLDVAVAGVGLACRSGLALHGRQRFLVLRAFARLRLVVAGDLHRPVGPLPAGIFVARDADAGGIVQQQVLAMTGGIDPLAERFLEIVVTVRDVFGGTAR